MFQLIFAVFSYAIAMGSLALYFWMIQFGLASASTSFTVSGLIVNLLLFALFPLQHSILARPWAKKRITDTFSALMVRPFYVLTSGIAMWIVLLGWQNFDPYLYRFHSAIVFDVIFYISLALIILATVALNHSMMFGLKQGYAAWKHLSLPDSGLQTGGLYGVVRHPITSLLLVALWSHSTLTASRLVFNVLFSFYAIAGTWFEERDLIKSFGDQYLQYRRQVPAFIPRWERRL